MNIYKRIGMGLLLSVSLVTAFAQGAATVTLIEEGDNAYARGQYRQALSYYQHASAQASDRQALYVKIARCFQRLGIQHSALAVTEKILANDPEHVEALLIQGEITEANADYKQALALYKQAEHIDSANPAVYYNQANVLRKMDRESDAEQALVRMKANTQAETR